MADDDSTKWPRGSGQFEGKVWNGRKWVDDPSPFGTFIGRKEAEQQNGNKGVTKPARRVQVAVEVLAVHDAPIKMTGTTTHGAVALLGLFESHQISGGGLLETSGHLVAEPENPKDANAIAVHCEGERIGYLPGYVATHMSLAPGGAEECLIQLWGEIVRGKLRVIGWVYFGDGEPAWPYSLHNPPPVSIEAERTAHSKFLSKLVKAEVEGHDPIRAARWAAGVVGGKHYLELIEPIKEMKRQGRLEEALLLCYAAIEGAERACGSNETPPPAYTMEAAIVLRKLGRRDEEVLVLERWLSHCPANYPETNFAQQRLAKMQKRKEISD